MESVEAKMKIYLGMFPVVEYRNSAISIDLGNNVHITMHLAGLPTTVEIGTKLPLFTEVPYNPEPLNALYVPPK